MSALLIALMILLYTLQSFLCKLYTDKYPGDEDMASSVFTVVSGLTVALISFAFAGFSFTVHPLTALLAVLNAIALYGYNICIIKASQTGPYSILMVFSIAGAIVIPSVVNLVFFNDTLSVTQIVSVLVIFASVYMMSKKKEDSGLDKSKAVTFFVACTFLAICNGIYGTFINVQQKLTGEEQKEAMVALMFLSAAVISVVTTLPRKGRRFISAFRQTRASCVYLIACSLVSALAINLLVLVLPLVDLTVLYTFDNSGVMLLSVLASWIFLKEKLSLLNIIGCITMCAGLIAVTLG